MSNTEQEWRVVPGLDAYEVSDLGDVRNATTGRIKAAQQANDDREPMVELFYAPGRRVRRSVRSVIALAFLGPCRRGFIARRIDPGGPCSAANLAYVPRSAPWKTTLTESDVRGIIAGRRIGVRVADLAAQYHVTQGAISHIAKGRTWKHLDRSASSTSPPTTNAPQPPSA